MLLVLHCIPLNPRQMQTITVLMAVTIFITWVLWTLVLTTVSLLIIIFNDELSLLRAMVIKSGSGEGIDSTGSG